MAKYKCKQNCFDDYRNERFNKGEVHVFNPTRVKELKVSNTLKWFEELDEPLNAQLKETIKKNLLK